ncbi:hypothetical protein VP01_2217g1 [Puccinia sorghi]|uniref:Uncharacterized protein n=1 Tax=Puccinia sorghi TaxID=27349 RepID=A0A0L6VAM9_9BASI|nr:hypothetical protein VP01_2217g1 [Puccinia sorghi]
MSPEAPSSPTQATLDSFLHQLTQEIHKKDKNKIKKKKNHLIKKKTPVMSSKVDSHMYRAYHEHFTELILIVCRNPRTYLSLPRNDNETKCFNNSLEKAKKQKYQRKISENEEIKAEEMKEIRKATKSCHEKVWRIRSKSHQTEGIECKDLKKSHESLPQVPTLQLSLISFVSNKVFILFFILFIEKSSPSFLYLGKEMLPPSFPIRRPTTGTAKKKKAQLPAVDMQHASAKLSFKLHLFEYVYVLAQPICIKACLNHSWRKVGVIKESSWEFLHFNCRQLSKFFLQSNTVALEDLKTGFGESGSGSGSSSKDVFDCRWVFERSICHKLTQKKVFFQLSHWSNIMNFTVRLVEIKEAELNQVIKTYEKVWLATNFLFVWKSCMWKNHLINSKGPFLALAWQAIHLGHFELFSPHFQLLKDQFLNSFQVQFNKILFITFNLKYIKPLCLKLLKVQIPPIGSIKYDQIHNYLRALINVHGYSAYTPGFYVTGT